LPGQAIFRNIGAIANNAIGLIKITIVTLPWKIIAFLIYGSLSVSLQKLIPPVEPPIFVNGGRDDDGYIVPYDIMVGVLAHRYDSPHDEPPESTKL